MLRAEVSAITLLLVEKGVFTTEEFEQQLCKDLLYLDELYQKRWPGATATDSGMSYDLDKAKVWMSKWRP